MDPQCSSRTCALTLLESIRLVCTTFQRSLRRLGKTATNSSKTFRAQLPSPSQRERDQRLGEQSTQDARKEQRIWGSPLLQPHLRIALRQIRALIAYGSMSLCWALAKRSQGWQENSCCPAVCINEAKMRSGNVIDTSDFHGSFKEVKRTAQAGGFSEARCCSSSTRSLRT